MSQCEVPVLVHSSRLPPPPPNLPCQQIKIMMSRNEQYEVAVYLCFFFCFFFFCHAHSLWGVYSETFNHQYNIPLGHSFMCLCTIFFTCTSCIMPLSPWLWSPTIQKFWNYIEQYILITFDIQTHLTVADVMFGINSIAVGREGQN